MTVDKKHLADRLETLETEIKQLKQLISAIDDEAEENQLLTEKSDKSPVKQDISQLSEKTTEQITEPVELTPREEKIQKLTKPLPPVDDKEQVKVSAEKSKSYPRKSELILAEPTFRIPDHMKTSEYWLNKIGISLLIFAVIFLFKYSIDQGWLIPPVRVGFGLLLGLVLTGLSFKLYNKRRHFALVLFGGAIATFYICGYAAFQMFQLVSQMTSLIYMSSVTIFAFIISVKQNEPTHSVIATIGGLMTPFLLSTGTNNIAGLMLYQSVLIAGVSLIYYFKSWRGIYWISVIGGWMITLSALGLIKVDPNEFADIHRWGLQYSMIFFMFSFWVLPVFKEITIQKYPNKYQYLPLKIIKKFIAPDFENTLKKHVVLLTVSTPVLSLTLSYILWNHITTQEFWGWVCMGVSMLFGHTWYLINKWENLKELALTHLLVGLLLLTVSFALLLDGNSLIFTLAAEALVLYLISQRTSVKGIDISSHIVHGVSVILAWSEIVTRFQETPENIPFLNLDALTIFWVTLTLLTVAFISNKIIVKRIYYVAGFIILSMLHIREFSDNQLLIASFVTLTAYQFGRRFFKDGIIDRFGNLYSAVVIIYFIFYHILNSNISLNEYSPDPVFSLDCLYNLIFIGCINYIRSLYELLVEKRAYLISIFILFSLLLVKELGGNLLLVLLAAEFYLIHFVATRNKDEYIGALGHLYGILLFFWMIDRLMLPQIGSFPIDLHRAPLINLATLSDSIFVVSLVFAGVLLKEIKENIYYYITSHFLILAILLREFQGLENGQGLVTISWGVYGAILLVVALLKNIYLLRIAGLTTLFIVVGKLFIVDLANIETIWRILLFTGFGAVFLFLSYYFKSWWKKGLNKNDTSEVLNSEDLNQ